jgi:hypothetical protein
MIWVGSFKSLQSVPDESRFGAPLEVHTWPHSESGLISAFAERRSSLNSRFGKPCLTRCSTAIA